jgi:hypothetical protein
MPGRKRRGQASALAHFVGEAWRCGDGSHGLRLFFDAIIFARAGIRLFDWSTECVPVFAGTTRLRVCVLADSHVACHLIAAQVNANDPTDHP